MDPVLLIRLAGGLAWLLIGGDVLVRGAVALARRLRVPAMVIALTVVAFGTSLPELVVVVQATLGGYPDLVFGNVVGSNIANVLLVAGAAAAVYPLTSGEGSIRRDGLVMLAATGLFMGLSAGGLLGRVDGVILLAVLFAVISLTAGDAARAYRKAELKTPMEWVLGLPTSLPTIGLFLVAGAVGLPVGADLVVDASVEIAANLGVSEVVVGLTILAIGTSLPELATTVVAAVQKRTEVAIGTIVGSNIFNVLGIMGVGAVISPVPIAVTREFLTLHFPVMLGAAILIDVFVWRRRPVGRAAGVVFLALYAAYLAVLVARTVGKVG
ncbi:MAG: calcium/sodium antiporter [Gemmatimonadota bacterium]|nr:calcium/sodium antiporter [Gemmatimonadota bacterium]